MAIRQISGLHVEIGGRQVAKEYRQSDLWVMELEEMEWYGPTVYQQGIQQEAIKRGTLEGCNVVAILVQPDALFPMCGTNKKHRVFEQLLIKPIETAFKITTSYVCELNADEWHEASEKNKNALISKARDHLNANGLHVPGRYVITVREKNGSVRELERGRV